MSSYKVGDRGRCPHCNVTVHFTHAQNVSQINWATKAENIVFYVSQCPDCGKSLMSFQFTGKESDNHPQLIYPRNVNRPPVPKEVPGHIAQDYNEAALVIDLSPNASAALSRRCLQTVLIEAGQAKERDLAKQIDEVSEDLPGYLSDSLHAVRQIGNFAAHTQKSQITGAILDVEAGEAEWNLDVLDELFDHFYVKPALQQMKKQSLNQKLQEAGKPLLK